MKKYKILNYIICIIAIFAIPAAAVYLANYVIKGGIFVTIDYLRNKVGRIMVTYIPMLILTAIFVLIAKKPSIPYILLAGLSAVGGAGYYYKLNLRGEVLYPSDLNFLSHVGTMVGDYSIEFTKAIWITLALLAIGAIFLSLFTMPNIGGKYRNNLIIAFLLCGVLAGYSVKVLMNPNFYSESGKVYYSPIPTRVYYENTFHTAFFLYVNANNIEMPSDYSEEKIEDIMKDYSDTEGKKADIIVILDESFFLPNKVLGVEYSDDISYNYDRIAKTGVYGNMVSPKIGGGTGEIEFSVLNQIDVSLFPEIIAFMSMYGNNNLPSFINRLDGYNTYSSHSYSSDLYNRKNAYRNMGITSQRFIDDYEYTDNLGLFVSDMSNVNELIKQYKEAVEQSDGAPVFINNVSMQNHISMVQEIPVEMTEVNGNYSDVLETELSVIGTYERESDIAIGKLFDYLETVDREVIVILYGDHQSYNVTGNQGFTLDALNEIESYSGLTDREKRLAQHTTPFVMWSNKQDLGGVEYNYVSPWMLYSVACHEYGLEHSALEEYLYNIVAQYPVMDSWTELYIDSEGNLVDKQQCEEVLNDYYLINYDLLEGQRYSLK